MTFVARRIGDPGSRKDVAVCLIVMARAAFHFYLVVPMRCLSWQQRGFVFSKFHDVSKPASDRSRDDEP